MQYYYQRSISKFMAVQNAFVSPSKVPVKPHYYSYYVSLNFYGTEFGKRYKLHSFVCHNRVNRSIIP